MGRLTIPQFALPLRPLVHRAQQVASPWHWYGLLLTARGFMAA
jgi:hypothetical protein